MTSNTEFCRQLRQDQTLAERALWAELRSRKLNGYKFKRQNALGPYIVDFCCSERKLIIELDGGQHAERVFYDAERTQWLEREGYRVLRFWNGDVLGNLRGVLELITAELGPSPRLSLRGEE